MLHHKRQTQHYGCMWHALYAVTGDERALEHTEEISDWRHRALAAQWGYLLATLFNDATDPARHVDAEWWERLRDKLPPGGMYPLMISFSAASIPGGWHAVGLLFGRDEIQISDSVTDGLFTLSWPAFLASAYARAHRVETVGPADVDAYPPESARERLNALQQVLEPDLTL